MPPQTPQQIQAQKSAQASITNCTEKCMTLGKYKRNVRANCHDDCTRRRGGKRTRKNRRKSKRCLRNI
jgi:hypothetical protein